MASRTTRLRPSVQTGALAFVTLALTAGCGGGASSTAGAQAPASDPDVERVREQAKPERLVALGRAFAENQDYARAEQYFSAAISSGADATKVMPDLLRACIADGRFRVAIQHAENYLRAHPGDARTRFLLGTLYAGVGEGDRAARELDRVLATRPDDAEAHFALASVLRENEGDPVRADRHFREYLRLKPDGEHAEEARASLLKSVP